MFNYLTSSTSLMHLKGVVHFKKKKKTFADNLLTPSHLRYPCPSFFSRKEIKVFDEDFLHIMHFNGNQTVQGPKDNCSKGFKRFQTMNKGLIKRNNHS